MDSFGVALLVTHIFGVNWDTQAVEVAMLNLWMRLMIVERDYIRGESKKCPKSSWCALTKFLMSGLMDFNFISNDSPRRQSRR
jgi:hypothetical protein